MSALLQAELIKLRTTRTFVALTASALVVSLLVVGLTSWLAEGLTKQDVRDLFTADFSGLFIILLGVMGMAGEWRHRTITSTVLAAPDLLRLLTAKVLAYAVAGLLMSLAVSVTIIAVGVLILELGDKETLPFGDIVDVTWRNLAVAGFLGAFGVCLGAVLRNQVAGIVGVLIWGFAIEPAVVGLEKDVGQYLPLTGAPSGLQEVEPFEEELLAPGLAALVLLAWLAATFILAAVLLRKRDLVG